MKKKIQSTIPLKTELIVFGVSASVLLVASAMVSIALGHPLSDSLRAFFGGAFLLLLPGYVLIRLFLDKDDWIEILALSLGLSMGLMVPWLAFTNMILRIRFNLLGLVVSEILLLAVIVLIYLAWVKYAESIRKMLKPLKKIEEKIDKWIDGFFSLGRSKK